MGCLIYQLLVGVHLLLALQQNIIEYHVITFTASTSIYMIPAFAE